MIGTGAVICLRRPLGLERLGMFADFAVLDQDYFTIDDEAIKSIVSVLTIVNGNIVYASGVFSSYSPPSIPILPEWSPTKSYNGYQNTAETEKSKIDKQLAKSGKSLATDNIIHSCSGSCSVHGYHHNIARVSNLPINKYNAFWGALGCSCFAF